MTPKQIVDTLLEAEDPLLRKLAKVATDSDFWVLVQRVWDEEARKGYGANPWHDVFLALGYTGRKAADLSCEISVLFDESGSEEDQYSPEDGWERAAKYMAKLPPPHVDAIKRLWFRQFGM